MNRDVTNAAPSSIGVLARRTRLSVWAIRRYEEAGRVPRRLSS
ncbi:MAG: hypothetical protein ABIQ90_05790 [Polaromonas sp.]